LPWKVFEQQQQKKKKKSKRKKKKIKKFVNIQVSLKHSNCCQRPVVAIQPCFFLQKKKSLNFNFAPRMSYFDFDLEKPIVIDNGGGSLKGGWAAQEAPEVVFENCVGKWRSQSLLRVDPRLVSGQRKSRFVGSEAQQMRGVLSLRRPIQNGKIQHWDEWSASMEHMYGQLRAPMEEHPALITMARWNPTKNRERLVSEMFEHFAVPAVYVAVPSVLCLYSSGRTTGVVVGCGDGVVHADPIAEGFTLHNAARLDVGGRNVTETLAHMLRECGYSFESSAEREIVRDIKEQHAFVALDYDAAMRDAQRDPARFVKDYTLPDGQIISVGDPLFRCMEGIFQPGYFGRESGGIATLAFQSIMDAPRDLRRELHKNVLLCGGTTLAPGFAERIEQEFDSLVAEHQLTNVKINVMAPEERQYSVWIGGSILASLSTFDQCWYTKEDYDENGAHGAIVKFQ
jgi:actin-related protein